jgi:Ca2+-binding RTX toxin-like protein
MEFKVTSGGDYDSASSQDILTEDGAMMSTYFGADELASLTAVMGWNPDLEIERSFHIQGYRAYVTGGVLVTNYSGLYVDWRDEAGVLTATGMNRSDAFLGGSNSDILAGEGGNDRLVGNAGSDRLAGGDGDDSLVGGCGQDHGLGGFGNDDLWGGKGADHLKGNIGDDMLSGQAGNDRLTGHQGADTFVFADGFGRDTITDFELGEDKIHISGLAGFDDILDVRLHATQCDGFVSIESGSDRLILRNVEKDDLTASDFIF